MATVIYGDFEWDDVKAARNADKHGVTFLEAMTAFADPNAYVADDGSDSGTLVLIGFALNARLLTVVHAEVDGNRLRLISARPATQPEHQLYSGGE